MGQDEHETTWYHGSPLRLTILRTGSTITRQRRLAEAFSHKPTILALDDDGTIQHNGTQPGWLHIIAEPLSEEDIVPHPNSSMALGLEWLTTRELGLTCLGPVALRPEEVLDQATIERYLARGDQP